MNWKEAFDFGTYHILDHYDKREAQNIMSILLEDCFQVTNLDRSDALSKEKEQEIKIFIERLKLGEPIHYITGKKNFFGYDFMVNPNVLIPRPETEELVDWVIEDHKSDNTQKNVLDIGSGSGCISITIKKKKPTFRVFAVEESIEALNVGRINAKKLRAAVEFLRLDILDQQNWQYLGAFDLIISNPPYIAPHELKNLKTHVVDYEPYEALFVEGQDPLVFYKAISKFAQNHLHSKGAIYFEISEFFVEELMEYFRSEGWKGIELRNDLQGKPRMIKLVEH